MLEPATSPQGISFQSFSTSTATMNPRYMATPPKTGVTFLCQRSSLGLATRPQRMARLRITGMSSALTVPTPMRTFGLRAECENARAHTSEEIVGEIDTADYGWLQSDGEDDTDDRAKDWVESDAEEGIPLTESDIRGMFNETDGICVDELVTSYNKAGKNTSDATMLF